MKLLEWIVEIIILICVLFVFIVIEHFLGLTGLFLGLIIAIYLQNKEIRKIKRELYQRNNQ